MEYASNNVKHIIYNNLISPRYMYNYKLKSNTKQQQQQQQSSSQLFIPLYQIELPNNEILSKLMRILYRNPNFARSGILHQWQLKQIYNVTKIQSVFRSYERRYVIAGTLIEKIVQIRAVVLIQRWYRICGLRKKLTLHVVLKKYLEILRENANKKLYMNKKQYRYLTEANFTSQIEMSREGLSVLVTFNENNKAIIVHYRSNPNVPIIPLWMNAVNYGPGKIPIYNGKEILQPLLFRGCKTQLRNKSNFEPLSNVLLLDNDNDNEFVEIEFPSITEAIARAMIICVLTWTHKYKDFAPLYPIELLQDPKIIKSVYLQRLCTCPSAWLNRICYGVAPIKKNKKIVNVSIPTSTTTTVKSSPTTTTTAKSPSSPKSSPLPTTTTTLNSTSLTNNININTSLLTPRPSTPLPSYNNKYRNYKNNKANDLPQITLNVEGIDMIKSSQKTTQTIHKPKERYLIEKDEIVNTVRMEHMAVNNRINYNNDKLMQEKLKLKRSVAKSVKRERLKNFRRFLDGAYAEPCYPNETIEKQNYTNNLMTVAKTQYIREELNNNKAILIDEKEEYLTALKEHLNDEKDKMNRLKKEADENETDMMNRIKLEKNKNRIKQVREKNNRLIAQEINRRQRQYVRTVTQNNIRTLKENRLIEIQQQTSERKAIEEEEKNMVHDALFEKYESLRERVRTQKSMIDKEIAENRAIDPHISVCIKRKQPPYSHRIIKDPNLE